MSRIDAVIGSKVGLENALRVANVSMNDLASPLIIGYKEWWLHFSNRSQHQHLAPRLQKFVVDFYKSDLIEILNKKVYNTR